MNFQIPFSPIFNHVGRSYFIDGERSQVVKEVQEATSDLVTLEAPQIDVCNHMVISEITLENGKTFPALQYLVICEWPQGYNEDQFMDGNGIAKLLATSYTSHFENVKKLAKQDRYCIVCAGLLKGVGKFDEEFRLTHPELVEWTGHNLYMGLSRFMQPMTISSARYGSYFDDFPSISPVSEDLFKNNSHIPTEPCHPKYPMCYLEHTIQNRHDINKELCTYSCPPPCPPPKKRFQKNAMEIGALE